MTLAEIITLIRTQVYATSAEFSDAQLISFINIVYHDLENSIIRYVKEDFFWNKYTTDIVAGQNEYVLSNPTATTIGMKKIKRVEAKFATSDSYRTVFTADSLANYSYSEDWLQTYQDKSTPIYTVSDNSIFLYPSPTNSVTGGLIIFSINSLIDLLDGDNESKIFPGYGQLRDFHYVLALGTKQYIYQARGLINEKNDSKQEYELERQKVISYLQGRTVSSLEGTLPNLSFYTS